MKEFLHWGQRCVVVCFLLAFCLFWGSTAYAIEILMGNEGMLVFEPCEVTISVGETVTFKNNELPPHIIEMVADYPEYSHSDLAFAPGENHLMSLLIRQETISFNAKQTQEQEW